MYIYIYCVHLPCYSLNITSYTFTNLKLNFFTTVLPVFRHKIDFFRDSVAATPVG